MAFNFFWKKSKKQEESQPVPQPEQDENKPSTGTQEPFPPEDDKKPEDDQKRDQKPSDQKSYSQTSPAPETPATQPPTKEDAPQFLQEAAEPDPVQPKPTDEDNGEADPVHVSESEPEPESPDETPALERQADEMPADSTPCAETASKEAPAPQTGESGLFSKLKSGLSKTRDVLNTDVTELFSRSTAIDEDLFEELEELLVISDLGVDIAMDMMERIRKKAKKLETGEQLRQVLKEELLGLFPRIEESPPPNKPLVIMMVGVNGTGKTTTLGKLATRYVRDGKKVLIAAADTFRAAAIEQVEIWADRANAGIVKHREGADPAAVAYDAVEAAMARGVDVVLIDTAGRLHTQKNLMEELKKIKRSVDKKLKGAPHQVMMVIDATTGQNAISQAKIFNEAVGLTHMAVTKLDGTAKGGIVAAVSSIMNLPISHIGVGEGIEDLQDFDAKRFINALFD
ncbi:MAG TPA: signal recognition particle-docking protein FtsY [Desulfobacteraceae bacterium]|nr:signal recognition particle-docking protein FtsY [Desulfobacteraceae bacterium]